MSTFNRSIKIGPWILSADFAALGAEAKAVEAAGADWIPVNPMDGHFAPNLTNWPNVVAAIRPHSRRQRPLAMMASTD